MIIFEECGSNSWFLWF